MVDKIYTKGFVDENLNYNLNPAFSIFNDRKYDPLEIAPDGRDMDAIRLLNKDIKNVGMSIDEYTYEEFLNSKDKVDGIDFQFKSNNKSAYIDKGNMYKEDSDDDLDDIIETAVDPEFKDKETINFQKFRNELGLDVSEEIYEQFIADNSFVKTNEKKD